MFAQWKVTAATLFAIVVFGLNAGVVVAQEHSHSHHSHGGENVPQLTLDHGKKWVTDDSLRQGMSRIRDALKAELHAIHTGKYTTEQYQALAQKVNDQLAFMVENCKLEPRADAALHIVLADIIAGADIMQTQQGEEAHQGVVKIHNALQSYAAYFDHPGWKGL